MLSFLYPKESMGGKVHDSIKDLHIDELIEAVIKDKDEVNYIYNVLACFETDKDVIYYRQEIIKDFLNNDTILDSLNNIFLKSKNIGDEYRALKKEKFNLQKYFSTFNVDNYDLCGSVVRRFCDVILKIMDLYKKTSVVIKNYDFKSEGLIKFKNSVNGLISNKGFKNLEELLTKIISMRNNYDMIISLDEKLAVIDTSIIMNFKKPEDKIKKKKKWESDTIDINEKTLFEMDYFITFASIKLVDRFNAIFEKFFDIFSLTSNEIVFYKFAILYNYMLKKLNYITCFPVFNDEKTEFIGLMDPYIGFKYNEECNKILYITPNNFVKTDNDGGVLVVGENNTGKTVYTRSIGINQIFSQSGLMITSKSANIKIYNQIITCYASKESHEFDGGRFETEVRALKYILDQADRNTIIIVNEIFQSTAADEGTDALYNVLAYMTEEHINWICVSHFLELKKMQESFYKDTKENIRLMETKIEEKKEGISYLVLDSK